MCTIVLTIPSQGSPSSDSPAPRPHFRARRECLCIARPCPRKNIRRLQWTQDETHVCQDVKKTICPCKLNHSQDAKIAMSASNGERGLVMMDELQRRLRSRQVNRRSPALVGDLGVCLTSDEGCGRINLQPQNNPWTGL